MPKITAERAALAVLCGATMLVYQDVASGLARDWIVDPNYSHGFLIPPLAAYLAWERRALWRDAARRPHVGGLFLVLLSLGLWLGGVLGAELFVSRVSLIGLLAGSVLYLWGPAQLRIVAVPLLVLLLMIPLPAIIFNQITFPLQLLASNFAEQALSGVGIPVLREGNLIVLAHTTLEVEEACSGIRSLMTLLTVAVVYAYFGERRAGVRCAVIAASVPAAVATNAFRVAGTGVAAHVFGVAAAEGFFHTVSSWMVFVLGLAVLFSIHRILVALWPARQGAITAEAIA